MQKTLRNTGFPRYLLVLFQRHLETANAKPGNFCLNKAKAEFSFFNFAFFPVFWAANIQNHE